MGPRNGWSTGIKAVLAALLLGGTTAPAMAAKAKKVVVIKKVVKIKCSSVPLHMRRK